MKASLQVEAIGDNAADSSRLFRKRLEAMNAPSELRQLFAIPNRYWVAEILGTCPQYGYERRFLHGKKDYTHANSTGSRRVYVHFILESGHLYEVMRPLSWQRRDRYFCTVTDEGAVVRLSREDAALWLQQQQSNNRSV